MGIQRTRWVRAGPQNIEILRTGTMLSTHNPRHQDGGADELDVAELAGALGGAGEIPETDGAAVSWVDPDGRYDPATHASTHLSGGADELEGAVILFHTTSDVAGGAIRYWTYGVSLTVTEAKVTIPIPIDATLRNLYGKLEVAPGAGENVVFIVRIEYADTLLTGTISGAVDTLCSDTVNSVDVNAGDLICVRTEPSAGVAAGTISASIEIVPR